MVDHMVQNTNQYEILIVDDTRDSLELLNRILAARGYRVRPASNGRLALKSVAAKPPDLILLDVKMPEMDGYEVCRRLKLNESSRKVPVIFISAFGDTAKKVAGFKAGGVDYITKPVEPEELLARVKIHLLLQELTERLESKVRERTDELTAANRRLHMEINERKQAEKGLKASEERFRRLAENARDIIYRMSLPDGAYDYMSPAATALSGYTPEEFCGSPQLIRKIIHPDWQDYFEEQWSRLLQGEMPATYEYPIIHKSGALRWWNQRNILIRDAGGSIIAIEGIVTDITDRKLAEEEIRMLNQELEQRVRDRTAQLERANKEMRAFTYTVSHDLRAPLRHIDGFLELLQKAIGTALDEQGRHYMEVIAGAANKMGCLIDDLLAFSRMGRHAMSFQPVDLGNLVREVIRELESEAAGRTIAWRIGELPAVGGDASMLRMVMTNLIANALKFTRPREKACIEVGCLPGQAAEAVIFVRDNGVGFDMTYADKLFGVFQRLHCAEEFEGTGIGLATVRRIVARHGGRTWADGEPDRGATFYFALPHTPQGKGDEQP
jgi:PAS domain S-box-containing protein